MFHWLHKLLYWRNYQEGEIIRAHIEANRKTVEDYRARFKSSPLGTWSHAVGTFGNVMNEVWEFNDDNTGKIIETGPFGGIRGETLFEWKPVADWTIACKVTKWSYEDEDDLEEDEDEEWEETWETIRYDFKLTPTDCGELITLVEVAPDGTLLSEFWHSREPLCSDDNW